MKYIIVTGGVLSGLGKGIVASSIGKLLISRGYKVSAIKIDPYLNCDAGTMSPYQHGEVFVLEDGGEVDLDLGNYERFMNINLSKEHNITTGKIYNEVIQKERKGEYLGETVQIIPHITNEIKQQIKNVANKSAAEITIVELGGTVGDIESMPFLEAFRQLQRESGGKENCIFVHTTLVPIMNAVGEQKTKPTQHSVKELRSIGIQPDIIIGRCERKLDYEIKRKVSLFCDVPLEAVISAPDVESIYQVPLVMEEEKLTDYLLWKMALEVRDSSIDEWKNRVKNILHPEKNVKIAIVGKYTHLKDSYMSYIEAFHHSTAETGINVDIKWLEAEKIDENSFKDIDGILVPGGFGKRGTEGKMLAITTAREKNIPFLGICLGFQLAVVEFCRNVIGFADANSSEFSNTANAVIDIIPEQRGIKDMGATMRLGTHKVIIEKNSLAHRLYEKTMIYERHRHRYEVNPEYIEIIEKHGMRFTGKSDDGKRMEILELPDHRFFIGVQFHPEFKSYLSSPTPLFLEFIRVCLKYKSEK